MSGAFQDFIPDGEDVGGAGAGFQDFKPAPVPTITISREEEIRQKRIESLEKARAAKLAKSE